MSVIIRPPRAAGLFIFLAALYFLFFSGVEVSTDERLLWDGVHSLAQQGNLWLNYSNTLRSPITLPDNLPVPKLDSEPGQVIASVPLFMIAVALPGLGLMQTVWLLNILITAATAALVYHFARLLGYTERVGLGAGLIFGAATIALPYTKTFFREPLFTFLGLFTLYAAERWRRNGQWRWLPVTVFALIATFITKDAAFFFLPALVIALLPAAVMRLDRRSLITIGIISAVALLILLIVPRFVAAGRFDVIGRIQRAIIEADEAPYALLSYLFSPGRGIFAFSPVLLLGLPGFILLLRMKRRREALVPIVALGSFAFGYAILQNRDWYGGTAWGPRYMLPVTPVLVLLVLPVLERFAKLSGWVRALIIGIIALSCALQLLAAYVPLHDYYHFLAEEGTRLNQTLVGWIDGTWNLRYIPQVILPQILNKAPLDLAWWVNQVQGIILACLILMALGILLLLRNRSHLFLFSVTGLVLLFYTGLRSAYADPRYGGNDPNAAAALNAVYTNLQPNSVILLGSEAYRPHFMNYYKGRAPIFQLPPSPGEVDIPGQPPKITAHNLDALVAPETTLLLARNALSAKRWLYVTEFIPGDTSRTRAMEHYLVRHYLPIREVLTTNTARVIEFSTQSGPPDFIPPWPAVFSTAHFGQSLTLVGYDSLPTIKAGEVLPVSLLWKAEGKIDFDYSVNVSLIAPDGSAQAQRSGTPQGTFGMLTRWQPGGYYRDNHGLAVPANAPRGEYEVWVLLYNWQDNSKLRITVRDQVVGDHLVLTRVRVE